MRKQARLVLVFGTLATVAVAGCTNSVTDLPDARFEIDGGTFDSGSDAGFPDPTIDTCDPDAMTIGTECTTDTQCDDGCYCNGEETCTEGVCAAGEDPCTDTVTCTDDACLEETNTCFHMPNHSMCSNMMACDGYEICDRVMGCSPGAPLYCNDDNSCTVDSCDDAMGCVYVVRDLDGDGYIAGTCGGDDCDDDPRYGGSAIFPGATEVCNNRRDDDCDGRRDYADTGCLPTNDTCDRAQMLPGAGTYSGSTTGLANDYPLTCASATGPDAVFRFTIAEPQDVRINVTGAPGGAVVGLRPFSTCATGPDVRCSSGTMGSVFRRSLPAGEWAIVVHTSTSANFDLQLMLSAPTEIPAVDTCGAGTVDVSAGGMFRGRFEETGDDYTLTCHAGAFRDAAYRLVLTEPSDVLLTATSSGGGATTTYLQLTTDCSSTAGSLACVSGTEGRLLRRGLAAGTYYVLLESSSTDATDWTLNVMVTTPPAARAVGDACGTAVELTPGVRATVPLSTLEFDSGTTCGTSAPSRDAFFHFRLAATSDVTLTTEGATYHYMALQATCGVPGSEVRCRASDSGAMLTNTWRSLPAGDYWVVVQTTFATGNATALLDVRPATPVPPNDRCTGAITLVEPSTYRGTDTLVGFEDEASGWCGGGAPPALSPDSFYTFTLATRRRVIISTAAATGTPTVYLSLRAGLCSAPPLSCNSGAGSATINQVLDPATYYVVVEERVADAGDYSISFTTLPP